MTAEISTQIKRTNIAMLNCVYDEKRYIRAILTKKHIFWHLPDALEFFQIPKEWDYLNKMTEESNKLGRIKDITWGFGIPLFSFTETFISTEILLILARTRSPNFLESNLRKWLLDSAIQLLKEDNRKIKKTSDSDYSAELDTETCVYQELEEESLQFIQPSENGDLGLILALQGLENEEDVTNFFEDFVCGSDPRISNKTQNLDQQEKEK